MATRRRRPVGPETIFNTHQKKAQVIIRFKPEAGIRLVGTEFTSPSPADVLKINAILKDIPGVIVNRLFEQTEAVLQEKRRVIAKETRADVPDLSRYYSARVPNKYADKLVENLKQETLVDAVYIKPPAVPPAILDEEAEPGADEPPSITPDFTPRQGYLNAAPKGIDARFAWKHPGGCGDGISIIDIEGAWNFNHEDLLLNQGGMVGGTARTELSWHNHGTEVAGIISGDHTDFGIKGICPKAFFSGYSAFDDRGLENSSAAIMQAANRLNAGDIILIELQDWGPRATRTDEKGLIPIEWWPDDFDAIRLATAKGIIVVEAGGNGWENLDDAIYDTKLDGFGDDWKNPFKRCDRDSGAIIVGAGSPPTGTPGGGQDPDRSRLYFSNYGSVFDAQGWGRAVATTGGHHKKRGNMQGGSDKARWYTNEFGGTSGASPIVVGALACCQGALKAAGRPLLTPARARELLRNTGSPQPNGPDHPATQRIGNRPDLRAMFKVLLIPEPSGEPKEPTPKPESPFSRFIKMLIDFFKRLIRSGSS